MSCCPPGASGLGGWRGAYKAIGDEFLGYLVDLCGLQPGDAVLDVGCGSGRMAVPLTGYLNREGRYAGFDVSRKQSRGARRTSRDHTPTSISESQILRTNMYNPKGKYKSSDFRFPYPDGSFDVVFLASVFTHMLPPDVEHYMYEIVRVLKPGGRSLITFFLLNEESSALIKEGKGNLNFEYEMQGYRTTNVKLLKQRSPTRKSSSGICMGNAASSFGNRCATARGAAERTVSSFQDVVIAVKPARLASEVG